MSTNKALKIGSVSVISGTKEITASIDSIRKRGKRLDADIHRTAVSAVNHRILHGDNTFFNALVDAMPKGSRSNAMIEWFVNYGSVEWSKEEKKFKNDGSNNKDDMVGLLSEGAAHPYWQSKVMEGTPYSASGDLDAVLKYLESHVSKAETKHANDYATALKGSLVSLRSYKDKIAA